MDCKLTILKQTAEGENISLEANFDPKEQTGEELRESLSSCFDLIDIRLREMNMRVIASNRMVKKMPAEAQVAISQAIDMLFGRAPKQDIVREYEAARREAQEAEKKAEAGHGNSGKLKKPVGNA